MARLFAEAFLSRTLLLAYDFPPMTGGIARCLSEIARHYPKDELLVSTGLTANGTRPEGRVDRVAVPSERLRTLGGLRRWTSRVLELSDRGTTRFVWAGNLKPAGYPALWLRAKKGIPYGVILYGLDLLLIERQVRRSPLKRAIARRLLGEASALVAISGWTRARAARLCDALGLAPQDHLHTVPLGADPERFQPGIETEDLRRRLGLGDRRWVLTVTRLVEHKGVDTGIQVLERLAAEFPDLGYLIAGTGATRDALGAEVERKGLKDRVRFLGEISDEDLPALYCIASLYLGLSRELPLQVEGFGLSMVEASACGLPVVACRSGDIPDAVQDGVTGLLVEPGNVGVATEAVRQLLRDADLS
ncbi:MAG TPA: glycosyltransferase, partial [Gemmatimonadales bacterium]|nr:glycosyltransferase [Gemmatimonadales bacterium]